MRIDLRSAFLAAVLLAATVAVHADDSPATDAIVVTLRETATASGSRVKIGDIADLQGGEPSERERLARLDLTELPLSSQAIVVSLHQVGFRLQLAGFDAGSFRLEGAHYVRVRRPAGDGLDAKIAALARQTLQEKLAGHADEVAIQLAQGVILPPLSADGADIHLEAELRSPIVPPCRVAVEVAIYIRGARRSGVMVYLDIKKYQSVPVVVRRIEMNEAFSADNVRMERVVEDNTRRAAPPLAALLGRRARHPLSAGHPVEADDVEGDTPAALLIHASDLVHLIAQVGTLQVKTRGEALQAGHAGQLIQVRNLDSKAIVTGRVVDRSTVEVDY